MTNEDSDGRSLSLAMRLDALDIVLALAGLYGSVALLMWLDVAWIPVKLGLVAALVGPALRRAVGVPVRPPPTTQKALGALASVAMGVGIVLALVGALGSAPGLMSAPDFEAQAREVFANSAAVVVNARNVAAAVLTESAEAQAANEAAAIREQALLLRSQFEKARIETLRGWLPYAMLGLGLIVAAEVLTRIRLKLESNAVDV